MSFGLPVLLFLLPQLCRRPSDGTLQTLRKRYHALKDQADKEEVRVRIEDQRKEMQGEFDRRKAEMEAELGKKKLEMEAEFETRKRAMQANFSGESGEVVEPVAPAEATVASPEGALALSQVTCSVRLRCRSSF